MSWDVSVLCFRASRAPRAPAEGGCKQIQSCTVFDVTYRHADYPYEQAVYAREQPAKLADVHVQRVYEPMFSAYLAQD